MSTQSAPSEGCTSLRHSIDRTLTEGYVGASPP
jgi:hypothetical protein